MTNRRRPGTRDGGTRTADGPRRPLWQRAKVRLQFTGWLQYLPTAAAAVAFLAVSAVGALTGAGIWRAVLLWPPLGIGAVLLAAAVFDLVTVKLGVRPREALPRRRDDLDAFALMRARRSCRSFQSRDLTAADREELLRAARAHTRPERLIGTAPVRLEYLAAPLTVWPTVGAHEFLVAIAPAEYDRLSIIDVGRSLEKVVLHATRMGLGTCWIGPGADQRSIVRHLGPRFDPARDHVVCVCAVGYRSRFLPLAVRAIELTQHRRLPLESLFFADPEGRRPLAVDAPPFAAFARCFQACQCSPSSFNSQPTRGVALADEAGRELRRLDFCAATPSRYYAPVAVGIWCASWETGCEALGVTGDFRVLAPGERDTSGAPGTPGTPGTPGPLRYDVSWVRTPAAGPVPVRRPR